ncbi:MAG: polyphenol oxidase family protein [Planctomycetota bacterium]
MAGGAGSIESPSVQTFRAIGSSDCLSHAYAGRAGGVSPAPFDSLNVSISVGDAPENVYRNRERLIAGLAGEHRWLLIGSQVHGADVWAVTAEELQGVEWEWDGHRRTADALMTDRPGAVLMSLFADCPIALLVDPVRPAIALVHSGWRGTVQRILPAAVAAMTRHYASDPTSLQVGLSPHIGRCCFEVGPEVPEAMAAAVSSPVSDWFDPETRCLDLTAVLESQLAEAGITQDCVEIDRTCTRCRRDLYFSHRGDRGSSGRNGIAAVLI